MVGPKCFFPGPTKNQSLQIGKKIWVILLEPSHLLFFFTHNCNVISLYFILFFPSFHFFFLFLFVLFCLFHATNHSYVMFFFFFHWLYFLLFSFFFFFSYLFNVKYALFFSFFLFFFLQSLVTNLVI